MAIAKILAAFLNATLRLSELKTTSLGVLRIAKPTEILEAVKEEACELRWCRDNAAAASRIGNEISDEINFGVESADEAYDILSKDTQDLNPNLYGEPSVVVQHWVDNELE